MFLTRHHPAGKRTLTWYLPHRVHCPARPDLWTCHLPATACRRNHFQYIRAHICKTRKLFRLDDVRKTLIGPAQEDPEASTQNGCQRTPRSSPCGLTGFSFFFVFSIFLLFYFACVFFPKKRKKRNASKNNMKRLRTNANKKKTRNKDNEKETQASVTRVTRDTDPPTKVFQFVV